ncbi:hypothetical protein BDV10DRAFT_6958 [Aspergillus recurvatus]
MFCPAVGFYAARIWFLKLKETIFSIASWNMVAFVDIVCLRVLRSYDENVYFRRRVSPHPTLILQHASIAEVNILRWISSNQPTTDSHQYFQLI